MWWHLKQQFQADAGLPVVWCFRDCMENRIYDEQLMGIERNECPLIVLGKSYLKCNKMKYLNTFTQQSPAVWHLHFNVGLTGGAGKAAGTLFASVACPFTADVLLLTFPAGAFALLFNVGLLLDCDCASVDVTVVLDTCRDPDDLRPLDDPKIMKYYEHK